LLLPQIHLDGYHLAAESREMQLVLELPAGATSMIIVPKRYEKLEGSELGCNYLIGARIVRIDEPDQSRFEDFLSSGLNGNGRKSESNIN
jgi:hypothetical protein